MREGVRKEQKRNLGLLTGNISGEEGNDTGVRLLFDFLALLRRVRERGEETSEEGSGRRRPSRERSRQKREAGHAAVDLMPRSVGELLWI